MAAVEWACTKMHYGEGRSDEPWACIEYYPKLKPAGYYWWAHRPDTETVDGFAETLEDAQRLCEDVMYGETDYGRAAAGCNYSHGKPRREESAER